VGRSARVRRLARVVVVARIDQVSGDMAGEHSAVPIAFDPRRSSCSRLRSSAVTPGGPFVTGAGRVGGLVCAGTRGDTGYAFTVAEVRPVVEDAIASDQLVGVRARRF
jgi:hypothetical protein